MTTEVDRTMRNLELYMMTSIDGFMARPDGSLDWVPIDDESMGFGSEVFGEYDGIVFGRNVYQEFVDYWDGLDPSDPSKTQGEVEFAEIFRKMTRIVVSRTLDTVGENAVLINHD